MFDHTGKPFKRYNEAYLPLLMENDVKQLIGNCMKARKNSGKKFHHPRDADDDNVKDDFDDMDDQVLAVNTKYV